MDRSLFVKTQMFRKVRYFSFCHNVALLLAVACFLPIAQETVQAHPLGNFSINHFVRIEVDQRELRIRYVLDLAEIPTFQELQVLGVEDQKPTSDQLEAYVTRQGALYEKGLVLNVDDERIQLHTLQHKIYLRPGAGGLATLRLEYDLGAYLPSSVQSIKHVVFSDENGSERIGWREIVVQPRPGISVFNSTAFGNGLTDELKAYPGDMLAAPLNERTAEFNFTVGGVPLGARMLTSREGRAALQQRDRLGELLAMPHLSPGLILLSLLLAALLGAFHALSPGHGKTIVGAYLVGTRGTVRHAVFLGSTVTITHTVGVFALGFATLLASHYIVPERLFPLLGLISGALVVVIGVSLITQRLRTIRHDHGHHHGTVGLHSHGGVPHTHAPPGADGRPITWRSLLALGVSGGILPCPSALVVLLAAISLQRVAFGLLLVFAFSIGLAGVLTLVGVAFLYASRFLKSSGRFERLTRSIPIASALVVTCAGLAICYSALDQAGLNLFATAIHLMHQFVTLEAHQESIRSLSSLSMLSLGLVFGLKHATEADHIVAVSAIVSEQRKLIRAALVGMLWGTGHTVSLIVVGAIVLGMKIAIPASVASWLEFGVAIMIIVLGVMTLSRALGKGTKMHTHRHGHGATLHTHVHFHEQAHRREVLEAEVHSHEIKRVGFKPLIVGAVHGLAGSAALTLLVLTQISSAVLGLLYLAMFGLGSVAGMLLMSGVMGVPFAFGSGRAGKVHYGLQMLSGVVSIGFGIWYALGSLGAFTPLT